MGTHFEKISVILDRSSPEKLNQHVGQLHQNTEDAVHSGRNVTAGYVRGWGLEFGQLAEAISKDPVYADSLELARDRTLLPEHKLMNLYLIIRFGLHGIPGDIVEFGSYRGGSAIFMAAVASKLGQDRTVYAIDTFAGMPRTDDVLDLHVEGNFGDADLHALSDYVKDIGLTNLRLVPGLFEDVAPGTIANTSAIALAHIDCDIYDAVAYCLDAVKEHMVSTGGYIVLDDPLHGSCLGALQAVEEWITRENVRAEQAYPHLVYRLPKLGGLWQAR